MKYKRPESVLVVIYREDFRVLVMRRLDPPDFWQSVTGSLEAGEAPAETAIREVAEETGLIVAKLPWPLQDLQRHVKYPLYPAWRHRYAPGTTDNLEHWFALCVPNESAITLSPTEHVEFQWLNLDDALQRLNSPSNKAALRYIQQLASGSKGI